MSLNHRLGRSPYFRAALAILAASVLTAQTAVAQDTATVHAQTVSKAIDYLANKGQADDGSFSAQAGPGLTALVTTALLRHGRSVDDPIVARALTYLRGFVKPDGGIYGGDRLRTYETCVAMMCLAEANADGRYNDVLAGADKFVKGLQFDEAKGADKSNISYGGIGYSGSERPDLSNTSYLIDALRAAGNPPDDEAIQRALVFVSRCQNLESEHNTTQFAALVNDGGFYYTVAAGGGANSERSDENGGLRSYGSMTYSGLKSMVYAGLTPEDKRVKSALDWISKNYSVENNPGMGTAGLFYYYHTFAKALETAKVGELTDADGAKHDWRRDLILELAKKQQPDGSWINDNTRWLEGDPNLSTGFALLALSYCGEKKAE